jgi:hypothetical protein
MLSSDTEEMSKKLGKKASGMLRKLSRREELKLIRKT